MHTNRSVESREKTTVLPRSGEYVIAVRNRQKVSPGVIGEIQLN